MCLKYHPDKNVNASKEERERCEQAFKQIQEANSLIGNEEDRRKHDSMSALRHRYGSQMSSQQSSYASSQQASAEEAFQRFFQQGDPFNSRFAPGSAYGNQYRRSRRRSFYVNGVDISNLFDQNSGVNPFASGTSAATQPDPNAPRSIFIERVTVPLEELYSGVARKEFQLDNNLIQRYRAAFRGGIATQIALQSFLTSLPLLFRLSWPFSLLSFIVTFHLSVPRPTRLLYFAQIKAGWKAGTKLKFAGIQPGMDVVFIIDEGKHDRFQRDGNDLKTSIKIGKSKARNGCTLFIESLGSNELPITVKLKAGDITEDHQVVTVKGKGWPISGGEAGDLQITVSIISDARAERSKRRKSRRR